MAKKKARLSAQQQATRRSGPEEDRNVLYKLHDGPQTEMMMSEVEELLFGGALGGGKSHALRAFGVTYCLQHPGAHGVLFRKSYKELDETHLLKIQQEIPRSLAHYSSKDHRLTWENGSIYDFRYCESDADVRTYQSAEYDFIELDEAQQFTYYQYAELVARCRSSKPWWPGRRIRLGATPGDIGYDWIRERWRIQTDDPPAVEPFTIWTGPKEEGGMSRQFIPSRVTDNPALMKADPHYLDTLRMLPYEEYKMKALGDWSVFEGQFFQRFRKDIHVVTPFDIPADWDRFICVDYGFGAPYAALWFARPPGTRSAYVYREHYGPGIDLKEQVYRAFQASTEEKIMAVILDPSMFARVNVKGEYVEPMSVEWEKWFQRVIKGDNARVSGWRLVREMLDWTEHPNGGLLDAPHLFFFNTCTNLIRTLPAMIADKHNPEDLNSDSEDHAPDALRYGLRHVFEGGGQHGRRPQRLTLGPAGLVVGNRGPKRGILEERDNIKGMMDR